MRILIIEDDFNLSRLLTLELTHEGYETKACTDGGEGLKEALKDGYDIIILDLMLPVLSGTEILRQLRKSKDTPVIILTARDAVADRVSGLDIGADDYMTKPFATEELLARIRRRIRDKGKSISIGELSVDEGSCKASYGGKALDLTKKEFELLLFLMKNRGKVVSRETALESVWGYEYIGNTNVVDVYVRYLRSKIDDTHGVSLIETVRGFGYVIR